MCRVYVATRGCWWVYIRFINFYSLRKQILTSSLKAPFLFQGQPFYFLHNSPQYYSLSANRRAVAFPIPRLLPVTNATLFIVINLFLLFSFILYRSCFHIKAKLRNEEKVPIRSGHFFTIVSINNLQESENSQRHPYQLSDKLPRDLQILFLELVLPGHSDLLHKGNVYESDSL